METGTNHRQGSPPKSAKTILAVGHDPAQGVAFYSFGSPYTLVQMTAQSSNTKIKLLRQLLKKAITDFRKVNRIKGVDFSKKFLALAETYNEQDVLVGNVHEDFTDEIIDLLQALKVEKDSLNKLHRYRGEGVLRHPKVARGQVRHRVFRGQTSESGQTDEGRSRRQGEVRWLEPTQGHQSRIEGQRDHLTHQ